MPSKNKEPGYCLNSMSGLSYHWSFPIPSQCSAPQLHHSASSSPRSSLSVFISLLSFQMTQDLTVVWRADLLPRQLEEMLERVTVAEIPLRTVCL